MGSFHASSLVSTPVASKFNVLTSQGSAPHDFNILDSTRSVFCLVFDIFSLKDFASQGKLLKSLVCLLHALSSLLMQTNKSFIVDDCLFTKTT